MLSFSAYHDCISTSSKARVTAQILLLNEVFFACPKPLRTRRRALDITPTGVASRRARLTVTVRRCLTVRRRLTVPSCRTKLILRILSSLIFSSSLSFSESPPEVTRATWLVHIDY